jgi:hypothetical protein
MRLLDFFFNLPFTSSCIMTLELTQPVTEMSTRNLPGGQRAADTKGWQPHCHLWADCLETAGASICHNPVCPWPVTGVALTFYLSTITYYLVCTQELTISLQNNFIFTDLWQYEIWGFHTVENLEGRSNRRLGKNWVMRSFVIYILQQLFSW